MVVTKENTGFGSKIQFVQGIRMKKRVAFAIKDSQSCVIGFLVVEFEIRRCVSKDGSGQSVNDVGSTKKCINPILIGERGVGKVKPVSRMCRSFHSATTFCWEVCGQVLR
jgi:hypothetical protein